MKPKVFIPRKIYINKKNHILTPVDLAPHINWKWEVISKCNLECSKCKPYITTTLPHVNYRSLIAPKSTLELMKSRETQFYGKNIIIGDGDLFCPYTRIREVKNILNIIKENDYFRFIIPTKHPLRVNDLIIPYNVLILGVITQKKEIIPMLNHISSIPLYDKGLYIKNSIDFSFFLQSPLFKKMILELDLIMFDDDQTNPLSKVSNSYDCDELKLNYCFV